jgi:putative colanic acid biosynthesis UDP-glucose lipid carrier transferase
LGDFAVGDHAGGVSATKVNWGAYNKGFARQSTTGWASVMSSRMGAAVPIVQGLIYAGTVSLVLAAVALSYGAPLDTAYRTLMLLGASFSFLTLGRYDIMAAWKMGTPGSIGSRVLYSWFAVVGLLLFMAYVAKYSGYFSRVVLVSWAILTPVALALLNLFTRWFARSFVPHALSQRSAVIVFANESAQLLAESLQSSELYRLDGFFDDRGDHRLGPAASSAPRLGSIEALVDYVREHRTDVVFVMLPEGRIDRAAEIRDRLGDTTASVYFVPNFALYDLLDAELSEIEGMPVLKVAETPLFGVDGVFKQIFDTFVSSIALLLLAPLMLIIAVLIKRDSPGPVLFKQTRYGLNGQEFKVLKFRTMRQNDPDDRVVQVSRDDQRITRIGRVLRRTSLDELPQLFNVLRGEMSLVGPRPHAVQHNEYYRRAVKHYMVRHKVKPGITGWAQINGLRGETVELATMEQRVRYDLDYIRRWTPMLDIRILVKTALMVLCDHNAY